VETLKDTTQLQTEKHRIRNAILKV